MSPRKSGGAPRLRGDSAAGPLGLRATEVAGLRLDDIDWHHGEITGRGKGRRDERMPLPAEVGQALVDYLMRPRPSDAPGVRTVFLAARAPRRPMDRVTVSSMIGRACVPAGIAPVGARLLRHTLGEAMIRAELRWLRSPRCCVTTTR